MKYNIFFLLGVIALMFLCGCADQGGNGLVPINNTDSCSKPYIISGGGCCLDMNGNGVCDSSETPETTTTLVSDAQALTNETFPSSCFDGVRDGNEIGVDCGGSCKLCGSVCDALIGTAGVKPAAQTTKLCLSSKNQTSYAGLNFSIANSSKGLMIIARDANGTVRSTPLLDRNDMSFDNIALRYIGAAKKNSINYVGVYAWVADEGVSCSVNSDCGSNESIGYLCQENNLFRQYYAYTCIEPGTIFSECQKVQKQELVKVCGDSEICVSGEDQCFPKECSDGVEDQDEEGVDCGGSCRPCHCFNGVRDANETGVDCGGECRPCLGNYSIDKTPPVVMLASPENTVYTTHWVDLNYQTDEPVDWCGYSLNGRPNNTVSGNGTIYAQDGDNELILYCRDSAGNVGFASEKFSVFPNESQVCPDDSVTEAYSDYFDSVIFYRDTESELGVPEKCTQTVLGYALTYVNDSDSHYSVYDATNATRDRNLTGANGMLDYDCSTSESLDAGYAVLKKEIDVGSYSTARMILYFSETQQINAKNTFWRIYSYEPGTDGPSTEKYSDIPYKPLASKCGKADGVLYQELDFSGLLEDSTPGIHLRLTLYGTGLNPQVNVKEAELFLG